MPQASNPDSKRLNPRDYSFFPGISVFIPTVAGILIAIFGTAWTFTLAFKPPQVPKSSASFKTTLKLPIVQPTLSKPLTNTLHQNHPPLIPRAAAQLIELAKQNSLGAQHSVRLNTYSLDSKNVGLAFLKKYKALHPTPTLNKRRELVYSLDKGGLRAENSTVVRDVFSAMAGNPEQTLKYQSNYHQRRAEPISNRQLTPNQPKSDFEGRELRLALLDTVILVLENNRAIKNAYLEQIAQRQKRQVDEAKLSPNLTPTVSISIAQFGTNQLTTDPDLGLGATVSVKITTGGELSFRWATNSQALHQKYPDVHINDEPIIPNLNLSFTQPLLRGDGVNSNQASIAIDRLTEQINILTLKSTLSETITKAIIAYRELIRAQERLKIAQLSLKRAQESLANNQILIEAGRLAPVDIVQNETEVARRKVNLIEAENNLESKRLALLNIVDIEPTTVILASDPLTIPTISINPNTLRKLAFENQPDYLKAQLDLEITKLGSLQSPHNRLWDLDLNTSYSYITDDTSDLRIGLVLSHQLGGLTVERDSQRSFVNQIKAENTLEEQRENLEIQLKDKIRDINLSFSKIEMAKKLTESSERQLEIAQEKQRLGRNMTIFELIRLQDELVQSKHVELDAIINYLNALTRLDQTLGTTLDTWQVSLERIRI